MMSEIKDEEFEAMAKHSPSIEETVEDSITRLRHEDVLGKISIIHDDIRYLHAKIDTITEAVQGALNELQSNPMLRALMGGK